MSEQELILYEVDKRIATITINRPDKAHAFNYPMLKKMHEKSIKSERKPHIKNNQSTCRTHTLKTQQNFTVQPH